VRGACHLGVFQCKAYFECLGPLRLTNIHILTAVCDCRACCRQSVVNEVNVLAHKVKGEIQALDQANAAAVRKKGQGVGSASERTRTSITAGATCVILF
jgi:hypothetical protein